MLWLDSHKPELQVISPATQKRLDGGNEFGDKAKGMFGPYEEMTSYLPNTTIPDKRKMVLNTKHHLSIGTENICEAAFDYNGFYCAVDILHKVEEGVYELYEVKDSPEVKPQFIMDAGYQAWVLDKCGIQLDGVYVVYHYDDEIDPFEPVDVTDETIDFAKVVDDNIYRLNDIKASKQEIMVTPGEQCDSPYECWYKDYCAQFASFSVSES